MAFITASESVHRSYSLTIANGEALSTALNTANIGVGGVVIPATWTAANLTVQGSTDGSTFFDLYDQYGTEYTITATAGKCNILAIADFWGVQYIRFRSGTAGTPVNQAGARTLTVLCR